MKIDVGISQDRFKFYKDLKENPLARASASFVASILLIFILFISAIQPTIMIITELRSEIEELEKVNKKLETKIQALNTIVPAYRELGNTINLIDSALPDNHEFSTLERQIRYLVTKNDLMLNSLSLSGFPVVGEPTEILQDQVKAMDIDTALADQSQIMFISINLNITGEYSIMKSFVNDFQKLLRVTTIDQMRMEAEKKSGGSEVDMTLRGNVYYLVEKES